jgi:hypothetical protein
MHPENHRCTWQAAVRLLKEREQELVRAVQQWEAGNGTIEVLADLHEEVDALRALERAIFGKAFPEIG